MNWYSLPSYYDVSFSHEMREELFFLQNIFNRYCKTNRPSLIEPACGTGRLIIPLARNGYDCTGFDLNEHALSYLKDKLNRNQLKANIFHGDMTNFDSKRKKYDAAYCTVDTFRHLLSEKQAAQHLLNISQSLKKNGIYILGLHLIPEQGISEKITRWTAKRGRLTVKTTMKMLKLDKKNRTETLKVILNPRTKKKNEKYESIYKLRTYTLKQFHKLLSTTGVFEVVNSYDHFYDLSNPITLNARSDYAVFVLRKKN
ncbi:MAG: SAM-dependent methyltransferase [Gammaproteobacteria bacterium]|jgi:SAM-dependent methyltransferase